jgi:hypothetical protein
MTDARSAAWDTYSQSKPQRRQTNAKGETTWFNWTQYADHGPGAEVLAATVLPAPEQDKRTTGTLLVRAVRGDQAQPF